MTDQCSRLQEQLKDSAQQIQELQSFQYAPPSASLIVSHSTRRKELLQAKADAARHEGAAIELRERIGAYETSLLALRSDLDQSKTIADDHRIARLLADDRLTASKSELASSKQLTDTLQLHNC